MTRVNKMLNLFNELLRRAPKVNEGNNGIIFKVDVATLRSEEQELIQQEAEADLPQVVALKLLKSRAKNLVETEHLGATRHYPHDDAILELIRIISPKSRPNPFPS